MRIPDCGLINFACTKWLLASGIVLGLAGCLELELPELSPVAESVKPSTRGPITTVVVSSSERGEKTEPRNDEPRLSTEEERFSRPPGSDPETKPVEKIPENGELVLEDLQDIACTYESIIFVGSRTFRCSKGGVPYEPLLVWLVSH